MLKHALEQKSPKVQSESLDWLAAAIKDFGFRYSMGVTVLGVERNTALVFYCLIFTHIDNMHIMLFKRKMIN